MNDKPLFSDNFSCPVCNSGDTVALYIPGDAKPDFVIWCCKGHVTVRDQGIEKKVYDFSE